jgi:hypothetical protein
MGDAEWVSWEAAVEWVAEAYQLSAGAAQAEFDAAIRSGRVQHDARLGTLPEPIPVSSLQGLGSLLLHDHRVNFADLQWQIGRQLDPPAIAQRPKGPKPNTTDKVSQERRMLFPAIDALRKDGAKSVTDAVSRLAGDRQLPGLATPENRKKELVKLYNRERGT